MSRQPPKNVVAAAQAATREWHIPASVLLAQWAVESGWGAHMPANSNNPFGEKCPVTVGGDAIGPHCNVTTREVLNGRTVWMVQPFKVYPTIDAAFASHAKHLATSSHYRAAMAKLPDPFEYVDAIAPTYATDPGYATALKGVIRSQGFIAYDSKKEPAHA